VEFVLLIRDLGARDTTEQTGCIGSDRITNEQGTNA
jgi:hypothetical protein